MKKNLLFILALVSCQFTSLQAQQVKRCGTVEYMNRLITENPALEQDRINYEKQIDQYVQAHQNQKTSNVTITIPVVFHVLWNTAQQNIPQARIDDQIAQLNKDYARLNADSNNTPLAFRPMAANTNIQFCLAVRDPNGNPTTGVIRKQVTVAGFDKLSNNNVNYSAQGGDDAWPRASYLNIWVCQWTGVAAQYGLLGISQFPFGQGSGIAATDGVCVLYNTVGGSIVHGTNTQGFNLGRTLTHEVGHWLNLKHIWGDDQGACTADDGVSDTPLQGGENYYCPAFPVTDNCTAVSPGVMFMNYMDYVDDNCMNMFTAGQGTRIASALNVAPRNSLVNSLGCVLTGINTNLSNLSVSVYPSPASEFVTVACSFAATTNATVTLSNYLGEIVYSKQLINIFELELPVDVKSYAEGIYNLTVRTNNSIAVKKIIVTHK